MRLFDNRLRWREDDQRDWNDVSGHLECILDLRLFWILIIISHLTFVVVVVCVNPIIYEVGFPVMPASSNVR